MTLLEKSTVIPSDQYFCFKWLHNSQMAGSDIMFPICVEIYCQNWTLRKTFIAQLTILIGQDSNLSYVVSQQPLKRLCHNKWPPMDQQLVHSPFHLQRLNVEKILKFRFLHLPINSIKESGLC